MGEVSTSLELTDGTSEDVAYFGDLFGVTHLPVGEPKGALVICSPIFSEFLKNNRREVMLGRRLAARGYAVQRFHYRGTGNSMGDPFALTLESMREDTIAAAGRLSSLAGTDAPAFLGTLLGAFPAAAVAGPSSNVILWDPTVDGRRYFSDLMKTLVIVGMSHGVEKTSEDLELEFESTARLDIAGFSLPRSLRDSALGHPLEIGAGDGAVLIVQLGRKAEINRGSQRLADSIDAAGRSVHVEPLAARETWWFHKDVDKLRADEGASLDEGMLGPTIRWLTGEESP